MRYILLLFVFHGDTGMWVSDIEFASMRSCQEAQNRIMSVPYLTGKSTYAFCFPKE